MPHFFASLRHDHPHQSFRPFHYQALINCRLYCSHIARQIEKYVQSLALSRKPVSRTLAVLFPLALSALIVWVFGLPTSEKSAQMIAEPNCTVSTMNVQWRLYKLLYKLLALPYYIVSSIHDTCLLTFSFTGWCITSRQSLCHCFCSVLLYLLEVTSIPRLIPQTCTSVHWNASTCLQLLEPRVLSATSLNYMPQHLQMCTMVQLVMQFSRML